MKRKMIISIAMICVSGCILGTTVLAQSATAKTTIVRFANMAASIEKSYGTILELDLTMRNQEPVYKANIITGGKRELVYFDAITGTELERKEAVELDEEEAKIYNDYNIAASTVRGRDKTAAVSSAGARAGISAEAKLTYEQAKEIAVTKVGGGAVKEIELDYEHSVLVYEVEIKYNGLEYELKIDASTGEIVKYKIDD